MGEIPVIAVADLGEWLSWRLVIEEPCEWCATPGPHYHGLERRS